MAQTKLDLSDSKFEQLSSETLHLSGCTDVHGTFELSCGSILSILPNPGQGKVLTSNAIGTATWQTLNITGATNGLTRSGQNVVLGGNLSGNTAINLNNHNFCITDGSGTDFINIVDSACTASYGPSNKAAGITNLRGYCTCLTQSISGAIFTDNTVPTPKGLEYANDYSLGYTCLSIPNAGWVTGQTSGVGGIGWSNLGGGSTVAGCGTPASASTLCQNIIFGVQAGASLTIGVDNVAVGFQSLYNSPDGNGNVGIGTQTLYSNTIGNYNIAIGYSGLYSNTCGSWNTAIGQNVLISNIDGVDNIGIGNASLNSNTSGGGNIGLGSFALFLNTTGIDNIALGCQTLYQNTLGCDNIALGSNTLYNNIGDGDQGGNHNIALGSYAGYCNTCGSNNIANGADALYSNTIGNNNIANGYLALYWNVTGCSNIAIGYSAGYHETGSNRLHIANCDACTLIYGEFDNKIVCINNRLITCQLQIISGASSGYVLTSDATGNASWQAPSGGTGSTGSALTVFTITGDSVTTGFTVNHAKNKQFVGVEVVRNSAPFPTVYTNVERTNNNCVQVTFDVAPTTGLEYKILIIS